MEDQPGDPGNDKHHTAADGTKDSADSEHGEKILEFHAEFIGAKEQEDQGIKPNTIRLSIGTEHIDDILEDLEEAFKAVDNNGSIIFSVG